MGITRSPTSARHKTSELNAERSKLLWIPAAAVLLAYLLRTFSLDLQSFWIDEVQAFYFVDHSFKETVKLLISPENNGPLYFLLLWGWRQIGGASDFAIRYLSDLLSVLTVAVLWQLARTWFGRRVAGLTALLLAISPFAVWFGQEAKMYALHMLLAALSTLLLIRAANRNRWTLWLAYGITLNLLGYSHFFGAFTILAQGILLVVTHLRKPEIRVTRSYLVTMAIVALPYIPVVRFAWRLIPNFNMQDISKGFVELKYMLQELASEYILRVSRIYVPHLWPLMAFAGVALALGLVRAWRTWLAPRALGRRSDGPAGGHLLSDLILCAGLFAEVPERHVPDGDAGVRVGCRSTGNVVAPAWLARAGRTGRPQRLGERPHPHRSLLPAHGLPGSRGLY